MYDRLHRPHLPWSVPQKFFDLYNTSKGGFTPGEMTMFGYLTEMDDAVGSIVAALKATGEYQDTLIVFSSE